MSKTISIKNLSYSYSKGGPAILDKVDVEVEKGSFYAILGASGSGKSTLLRLLSNILPKGKEHNLDDELNIFGSTTRSYMESGKLAFMFQEPSLMPNLDVIANVAFPLKLRGSIVDYDFVTELLDIVGLTEHQNKYPKELSGGMKTRVALARAFVTTPELLLLDEPFSALDISWKYELYRYLGDFAQKYNTTIVLVTHDIQEAILLGDKIMVLSKKGKVLTEREPKKTGRIDFSYESINQVLTDNLETSLGLQNDILIDGNRALLESKDEMNLVLEEIINAVDSNKESDVVVFEKIEQLRPFKNDFAVHKEMFTLWYKSNSFSFKFELIWFLLDNENISKKTQEEIFHFIKTHEKEVIIYGQNQEYFRAVELLLKTKERINDSDYPETKTWLYLTHGLLMSVGNQVLTNDVGAFVTLYLQKHPGTPYIEFVEYFLNRYGIEE